MRYASCAILGLALLGCSGAKPVAIQAGDKCVHCDRTISDTRLGAELVGTDGQPAKFHSPACLADYLIAYKGGISDIFVTDHDSGQLFSVESALFVRDRVDETTGERDYLAFRSATAAGAYARERSSAAVDWAAVRTMAAAPKDKKKSAR
jgi:copper chaperone NosL